MPYPKKIKTSILCSTHFFVFLFAVAVPLTPALAAPSSYSLYPGQSIAIQAPSLNPPVVALQFASLDSLSASSLSASLFGLSYAVDISQAQILDKNSAPSSIQALTIGDRINITGTLTPGNPLSIHAQVVQTVLKGGTGTPPSTPGPLPLDPIGPPPGAVYASQSVVLSKPGVFLQAPSQAVAQKGDPRASFALPVEPGKNYRWVTADFDMHISDFTGQAFNGVVVDLTRPDPKRDPKLRGYMSSWITLLNSAQRGLRTVIDTLDNRFKATPDAWTRNTNYHVQMIYDTESATVVLNIANKDTGQLLKAAPSPVSNTDLRDAGRGINIGFGLAGPGDSGAYMPPYGWTFSNLQVVVAGTDKGLPPAFNPGGTTPGGTTPPPGGTGTTTPSGGGGAANPGGFGGGSNEADLNPLHPFAPGYY